MFKHKKILATFILVIAFAFCSVAMFTGCATKNDLQTLNVVVLNKGYGREWIDDLAEEFERTHPGYSVSVEATASAKTLITSHINSKNNTDDLYICVGNDWLTYAARGLFAPLDDIMDDLVDGVPLKDKVRDEYGNSIYFPDEDGELHTYRLPWISATGGIFYNAKMFEKNGWDVPKTYGDLKALCETIVSSKILVDENIGDLEYVKPFVYTSQNPDYFDYTVYTWWAQLAGAEAITEFMQYESAENYNPNNPTYAKLKEATKMWYELFDDDDYVVTENTNYDANLSFFNGEAAMIFCADWMYNEIQQYQVLDDDFELAIMKTPVADDAVDPDIAYGVGEDEYIAIPASSVKQDLAKEFIKLIVSDYGCETFFSKANGLLAYKCDFTEDYLDSFDDSFHKTLVETRDGYSPIFTNFPSMDGEVVGTTKMLYLTSQIDIWGTSALRPYTNLLNSSSYTIDTAFTTIYSQISQDWSKMCAQAGVTGC